jgi:hypothetical protein
MNDDTAMLLNEIRELRKEIIEMKNTTSRMDGHIDFVENVFNLIKIPFMILMNSVSVLSTIQPDYTKPQISYDQQ